MTDTERRHSWVLYYDGDCGFCTFSVRLLAFVDFLRQVTWTNFQELSEPPSGLTWEDLDAAAYLEVKKRAGQACPTGEYETRLYRGFYAFRMLALRLLPLFPLVPLFWLPGVHRLGESAYTWVAANRYRISRRCRLKASSRPK